MKRRGYRFFAFLRHLEHVFFSMSPQYSQKSLPQTLHFTRISSGSPHMWQLMGVHSQHEAPNQNTRFTEPTKTV